MRSFLHRIAAPRAPLMAAFAVAAMLATGAAAQLAAERFPIAALAFLDGELPQMEAAIAARDRDYFEQAMARTVEFSDSWGFRTRANPALQRYGACTDAISDFTIVGLCRIAPSLDGCEPGLVPRFDANLQRCRDIAAGR